MGKKRKFNRFIRWIKSDLPEDNKSVLLLGVTKLPSPTPVRARPHTLHLDHHPTPKSQTLDNQPRQKPCLFRSHSGDSLNEILTTRIKHFPIEKLPQKIDKPPQNNNDNKFIKKVSFETENVTNKNVEINNIYEKQDFIMDKSVDSIGSCSLDVDASSTDFSDSSVGSSDCTLRSVGVPTPKIPSFRLETTPLNISEPKKPSYLNLACTVNGYSNITNYDSKLRENFRIPRSREVSPIRPQDYHAITAPENGEKSKFLTPNYQKTILNSPVKMNESKSQNILHSQSSTSYSYSSKTTFVESKRFIYDTVDQSSYHHTNGVSKFLSNSSSKTTSETYTNGATKSKSFIQQRVERLYGPGALAQGFFISKRSKNRLSESSENEEISSVHNTNGTYQEIPIETLDRNEIDVNNIKQSCSSPSLPVLRHLRPEFRAQLPILSPKRLNSDVTIQKSTTVPLSLTTAAIISTQNGQNDDKPLINGSKNNENKENIDKTQLLITQTQDGIKTVKLTDIITEEIPAAPQVILPVVTTNGSVTADVKINGNAKCEVIQDEIKDGHYFLTILKNETDRLIGMAVKIEEELEKLKDTLSDEQLGYLRSASGKARLLVTQKMQQFEGLCHKNINKVAGEQFPTTPEDLQGFWDMVMLQVTQVDELFAELDRLRANNWIIEEKPKPETSETKVKKLVVKKPISANTEAQRKQREAARKKMIEERRKAMKEKQNQSDQSIEIFIPESS